MKFADMELNVFGAMGYVSCSYMALELLHNRCCSGCNRRLCLIVVS